MYSILSMPRVDHILQVIVVQHQGVLGHAMAGLEDIKKMEDTVKTCLGTSMLALLLEPELQR